MGSERAVSESKKNVTDYTPVDLGELQARIGEVARVVKRLSEIDVRSREILTNTLRIIDSVRQEPSAHSWEHSDRQREGSEEGTQGVDTLPLGGPSGATATSDLQTAVEMERLIQQRIHDLVDENRRLKEELRQTPHADATSAGPAAESIAHAEGVSIDDDDLGGSIVTLLRSLLDATPDGLLAVDEDGTTVLTNRRLAELCGVDEGSPWPSEGSAILKSIAHEALNESGFLSRALASQANPAREILDFLEFKDGKALEVVSRPLSVTDGASVRVWIFREVTDRTQARGALYDAEAQYQRLLENLNLGFVACDLSGRILEYNRIAAEILGHAHAASLRGTNLLSKPPLGDDALAEAVKECMTSGAANCTEYTVKGGLGRIREGRLHTLPVAGPDGSVMRVHLVFEDMSNQKRAEELILRSQRLIMLGQMSSGLSHTFSNLLQVVSGNANMALTSLELGEQAEIRQHLSQIVGGTGTAAESIRLVQQFAKERSPAEDLQTETFDVSGVVAEGVELCKLWSKPQLDKLRIQVEQEVDLTPDCMVAGDRDQMLWVVVNLMKNAYEALPDGGRIRVQTARRGDQVSLLVQDNGPGIPDEDIRRITEAFWTSKESHAGMGLTVNSEIIRKHGGTMGIKRVKPHGTAFSVKLPAMERQQSSPPKPAQPSPTVPQPPPAQRQEAEAGSYEILLIDDERAVCTILGKGLRKRGNTAHVAMSGREGLDILRKNQVDAIICDLGMEGMNGWEVSEAVMEFCRDQGRTKPPFILLTGWGGQLGEDELVYHPHVDRIVEKPVTIPSILDIVGEEVGKRANP